MRVRSVKIGSGRARATAGVAIASALLLAAAAGAAPPDGLRLRPSLLWQHGLHRVDLGLGLRSRVEWWDAFGTGTDVFVGTRARAGAIRL